jgi:hypothetical protein
MEVTMKKNSWIDYEIQYGQIKIHLIPRHATIGRFLDTSKSPDRSVTINLDDLGTVKRVIDHYIENKSDD